MIIFLLKSFLLFLSFYVFGTFFYSKPVYEENFVISFYKKFFFGIIISIVGVSIYITGGKTFSIATIPLLVYWIYLNGGFRLDFNKKRIGLELFILSALSIVFSALSIKVGGLYGLKENVLVIPHRDIVFYEDLTEFIFGYGIETRAMDVFNPSGLLSFYHYADIYLNGIFKQILDSNPNSSYTSCLYVLSILLFGLGAIGLSLQLKNNWYQSAILAVIILGFKGLYLNFLFSSDWVASQNVLFSNLWYLPKLSFPIICSIMLGAYLCEHEIKRTMIILYISSLLFLSMLPQYLLFGFFVFVYKLYNDKKIDFKFIYFIIIPFMIILLCLYFFNLNMSQQSFFDSYSLSILLKKASDVILDKMFILISFITPAIIFCYLLYKKNDKKFNLEVFYIVIYLLAGFSFFIIGSFNYESFQFLSLSFAIAMPILTLLLFNKLTFNKLPLVLFIIISFFSSIFWLREFKFNGTTLNLSKQEQLNLNQFFKNIHNQNGAFYLDEDNLDANTYFQNIMIDFGIIVKYFKKNAHIVSVSSLKSNYSDYFHIGFQNQSSLKRFEFFKHLKHNNQNKIIRKFLSTNKIEYLITRDIKFIPFIQKSEIKQILNIPSLNETYIRFRIND